MARIKISTSTLDTLDSRRNCITTTHAQSVSTNQNVMHNNGRQVMTKNDISPTRILTNNLVTIRLLILLHLAKWWLKMTYHLSGTRILTNNLVSIALLILLHLAIAMMVIKHFCILTCGKQIQRYSTGDINGVIRNWSFSLEFSWSSYQRFTK